MGKNTALQKMGYASILWLVFQLSEGCPARAPISVLPLA